MFFPFMDYRTFDFNIDDGDNDLVVTLTGKAFVAVEWTQFDIQANESVRVYAVDYGSVDTGNLGGITISHLYEAIPLSSDVNQNKIGGGIFPSGTQIRATSNNENNVEGIVHVFYLPTSP